MGTELTVKLKNSLTPSDEFVDCSVILPYIAALAHGPNFVTSWDNMVHANRTIEGPVIPRLTADVAGERLSRVDPIVLCNVVMCATQPAPAPVLIAAWNTALSFSGIVRDEDGRVSMPFPSSVMPMTVSFGGVRVGAARMSTSFHDLHTILWGYVNVK